MNTLNNFVITIATSNGSGSQSSNNILVRSLFRMGVPVGGKNLFPSNIQGLPTWFTIRASSLGFTARKRLSDIVVAMNQASADSDLSKVKSNGIVFHNSEIKFSESQLRSDITLVSIPFREIVAPVSDSVKLRKLLTNMVYVGILAELLKIPENFIEEVTRHQFGDKDSVIDSNIKAIRAGFAYAKSNLANLEFPYQAIEVKDHDHDKVLIDGNTAAAMGLIFGGCTFIAWYPITPSSSLVETFSDLAEKYRKLPDNSKSYAVVQAEDELASIAMVVGAGWTGARAMTATSGPGLSLMGEAAGLSYFAEIPAVIWDVQRVGPSTGLPTRTMQGDLLSAYTLSHGDTKHVVLLPASPEECFSFGQMAFDLSERLQTLVIVLSDLDTGMNLHASKKFSYPTKPFDRGKILTADDLNRLQQFKRYQDIDGDGICARTLPGTAHKDAAYFTRGTGHDEAGLYSESPEMYQAVVDRLKRKLETAKEYIPKPEVNFTSGASVGLLYYGSSLEAVTEAQSLLKEKDILTSTLRVRALPFTAEVNQFIQKHSRVYVIEQNRDAQMLTILRSELPQYWEKCFSVLHYDGLPLNADTVVEQILKYEGS